MVHLLCTHTTVQPGIHCVDLAGIVCTCGVSANQTWGVMSVRVEALGGGTRLNFSCTGRPRVFQCTRERLLCVS